MTSLADPSPATDPSALPGSQASDPVGTGSDLGTRTAITRHELHTPRGTLRYQATAGYEDLLEEDLTGDRAKAPRVRARYFLTSYEADVPAAERSRRPVIFVFNGGPGSSSVWLHLGLFGPRRVVASDGVAQLPPPALLVDNHETPLWHSDIVIIDAISTGYSRVAEGEPKDEYHGVIRDVEATGDLIRLWITRRERWLSPTFIAGESYGVLRSTKVADYLGQRYGLYLSGLLLISSTLGGDTMRFGAGAFLSSVAFLPSYAAVAHYHGLHDGRTLAEVVTEAEDYALGPYLTALAKGNRITPAERAAVIDTVARLTGLRPEFVDNANLRISNNRFFPELLRSRGLVVGRNDGRFTGWNADNAGEKHERDPSSEVVAGAYSAAINHYLRAELGYRNDLPYEITSTRVRPWKAADPHTTDGFDSVAALSRALRTNRHLKVSFAQGYYDLCTPYFGAVHDLAQLQIPPELEGNIEVTRYESGHMIYVDEASRVHEAADIEDFITRTVNAARHRGD